MEENRNSKRLNWIIITITVLVLGIVGYIVYDNFLKVDKTVPNYNNTSSTTTSTTLPTTKKIPDAEKNDREKLIEYGYKEIDINSQEETTRKMERDLSKLNNDLEELKKYYINEEIETFSYNNGKIIYSFNNNKVNNYQEIEDIKEIKYNFIDCMGSLYIFAITNDGDIWYKYNITYHTDIEQAPKFVKLKGKYIDVESLMLHSNNCGATVVYLAKDNNGNFYNIENEILFEKDIYYINDDLNFKIMDNRGIYFDNQKTEVLFSFGLYEIVEETMQYFVSSDNYLYDSNFKKYSNSKIKSILYKDIRPDEYELNNFIIIFEDGKYFEEIFYVNLEN